MIRALTALIGFALAAVVLYFVPDAGDIIDNPVWDVPLLWAAAGLVAGIFYQAGGLRRPGMRINVPLFLFVFIPWTVIAAAVVASGTGDPTWLADEARSVAGDDVLARWSDSLAAFAFASGLLLAFSVLEPRVGVVEEEVVEREVVTTDDEVRDTVVERPVADETIVAAPVAAGAVAPSRVDDEAVAPRRVDDETTVTRRCRRRGHGDAPCRRRDDDHTPDRRRGRRDAPRRRRDHRARAGGDAGAGQDHAQRAHALARRRAPKERERVAGPVRTVGRFQRRNARSISPAAMRPRCSREISISRPKLVRRPVVAIVDDRSQLVGRKPCRTGGGNAGERLAPFVPRGLVELARCVVGSIPGHPVTLPVPDQLGVAPRRRERDRIAVDAGQRRRDLQHLDALDEPPVSGRERDAHRARGAPGDAERSSSRGSCASC